MASLPRRNVPPPISTTASGSNNAVMPVTSPAFSLATNNRSKSWGSLAGSLVVESFIVTLLKLLWVARPSLKPIVVTRRASTQLLLVLRTLKVLLRRKVNNEVSDHGNRISVTHTRGENPSRNNLNVLLLVFFSPVRQPPSTTLFPYTALFDGGGHERGLRSGT